MCCLTIAEILCSAYKLMCPRVVFMFYNSLYVFFLASSLILIMLSFMTDMFFLFTYCDNAHIVWFIGARGGLHFCHCQKSSDAWCPWMTPMSPQSAKAGATTVITQFFLFATPAWLPLGAIRPFPFALFPLTMPLENGARRYPLDFEI